jgi:hypothetical protein
MPKRYLAVRNKGNEHEQQQSSATTTTKRSSSKRASTDESIPAKRAKTGENNTNKENVPESSNNEREFSLINSPIIPILHGLGLLKPSAYDADDDDESEDDNESSLSSAIVDDSDDEFEEKQEEPISSLADNDKDGEVHPTNKQYLLYKNPDSTKEDYIISKTARFWSLKYRKVLRHVNPDAYGMYIHSDFSCYGELEVVENCLLDLTKTIFIVQQGVLNQSRKPADKINYILAFRRLEALTILLDYTDGISGIDDGDRFYDIMRVIGACYVTILQGLLPKIMFEKIENIDENLVKKLKKISQQLPNFKQVLEQALIVGYMFLTIADVCSAYTQILQVYVQTIELKKICFPLISDCLLQLAFYYGENFN